MLSKPGGSEPPGFGLISRDLWAIMFKLMQGINFRNELS